MILVILVHIRPILYGGLGNQMFQIAASCVLARSLNRPCLIGFWKHWCVT
jgi:hypothetical protein